MTPTDQATGVVRRRVLIHGHVQGVGFRASCLGRAAAAGLGGWVRNTERGEVEAAFEGPVDDVESLVQWCRQGPSWARVDGIDIIDEPAHGETTFSIR